MEKNDLFVGVDLSFAPDVVDNKEVQYKALARRYRPCSFSEIIGQSETVEILQNSIIHDRLPQAVLLTGIRGVGKTTMARIFAKALNCVAGNGPTVDICNRCTECIAISSAQSQDVVEMDAASYTSVNDIRSIIENIKYKPVSARYSIYIIDEVHMLSNSAFNALLKTLEEPPPHVKFIFATTESHKIPATILSRCQKFHLKRVASDVLYNYFGDVLKKEGVSADDESLAYIVSISDGSVRDGLSIIDQVISFADDKNITFSKVRKLFNIQHDKIVKLLSLVITGNTKAVFCYIDDMRSASIDPVLLLDDLLCLLHHLLKVQPYLDNDSTMSEMLSQFPMREIFAQYGQDYCSNVVDFAAKLKKDDILGAWDVALAGFNDVKLAGYAWIIVEVVFAKLVDLLHKKDSEWSVNNTRRKKADDSNCRTNVGAEIGAEVDACSNNRADVEEPEPSSLESRAQPSPIIDKEKEEIADSSSKEREKKEKQEKFSCDAYGSIHDAVHALAQYALREGDMMLYHWLMNTVSVCNIEEYMMEVEVKRGSRSNIVSLLANRLRKLTGEEWHVVLSSRSSDNESQLSSSDDNSSVVTVKNFVTVADRISIDNQNKQNELLQNDSVRAIIGAGVGLTVAEVKLAE